MRTMDFIIFILKRIYFYISFKFIDNNIKRLIFLGSIYGPFLLKISNSTQIYIPIWCVLMAILHLLFFLWVFFKTFPELDEEEKKLKIIKIFFFIFLFLLCIHYLN